MTATDEETLWLTNESMRKNNQQSDKLDMTDKYMNGKWWLLNKLLRSEEDKSVEDNAYQIDQWNVMTDKTSSMG